MKRRTFLKFAAAAAVATATPSVLGMQELPLAKIKYNEQYALEYDAWKVFIAYQVGDTRYEYGSLMYEEYAPTTADRKRRILAECLPSLRREMKRQQAA